MAQHLRRKLNWDSLTELVRPMSTKLDIVPSTTAATRSTNSNESDEMEEPQSNSIRYNVCRNPGPAGQKFDFNRKSQFMKLTASEEQEQEAKAAAKERLDEGPVAPAAAEGGPLKHNYRTFAESKTYKNVILPLKSSKLANPFPEPVKMMPSHTVSDQEKADQMQAECRVPRSITKRKTN